LAKLLLVDPSEEIRFALTNLLRQDYTVFSCASGDQALELLRRERPDLLVTDIKKGDVFLLCSDGLNSMVEDAQIEKTLCENNLERAADSLMEQALAAGGRDNVTVVLYSYHGKGVFPWSKD